MNTTVTDADFRLDEAIRTRIAWRSWYRHWRESWPKGLPGKERWEPLERENRELLRALLAMRRRIRLVMAMVEREDGITAAKAEADRGVQW